MSDHNGYLIEAKKQRERAEHAEQIVAEQAININTLYADLERAEARLAEADELLRALSVAIRVFLIGSPETP